MTNKDIDPTVASLFVRCLEAEGVSHVFGVPGEENEALLFALEQSSIEFVPTRHEQGAAFIADVWGRLSGKAGVCLATLGPGATNLLTGVADAHLDKAPLVAITAQGSTDRLHHESHQLLDIVEMFKPVTKWNISLNPPEITAEVVRKAFKLAEQEKPGATHIELPEDIASAQVPPDLEILEPRKVRRPRPDQEALRAATELLKRSKRPLILAGNGAIRQRASRELTRFAERFGIPVAHTFMGKGAVSDALDLSLLAVGLGFRDYVLTAFEQADLVLTIGYDIAEYAPESWHPRADKPLVHLDFSPAEVYSHYAPEVEVVADLAAAISELGELLADSSGSGGFESGWWLPVRQQIVADLESYRLQEGDPLTVPGTLAILRQLLDDDALLISDVGSHKMWIARNFPTHCPNGCLISNGLASMGIALPGAIAAKVLDPDRTVVAAMGDGGFLMNCQELETAHRLNLDFTVVLFNDDDYGLISWKQERSRGRSTGTRIGNPDFITLAESFGFTAYRPTTVAELRQQLEEAIGDRGQSLVVVDIDTSVNGQLIERLERYWEKRA